VNWNRFTLLISTPFLFIVMLIFGLVISAYCSIGEWRDAWKDSK